MAHSHGYFQKPDAEFIAQINSINDQCHLHQSEWKMDDDLLGKFDTLAHKATAAYTVNSNLSTKNALTAAGKKAAFDELKHLLGMFVNCLLVNKNIPDAAIAAMGLRPRHRTARKRLPPPVEAPALSVKKGHNTITVYAHRPVYGHATATTAPAQTSGFVIRYTIEGQGYYQKIFSSRVRQTISFNREDEGKRILLSAAWLNPSFETGPWSDEISEIIG
ncbi:MAG: hypothetical protein LBG31_03400 [Prevotellaceae bacterium]|jgi:hypothetical protein|nr:hypothetical protein [Prevotellaceae bacterium]